MSVPTSTRRVGLDVIRSVAILLVIAHHLRHVPGLPDWAVWFGLRGFVGVDLFFVLSGWLIGGQLFRAYAREGSIELWRFWLRRWWRTLPAYLALVLVLLGLGKLALADVPSVFLFLQNYTSPGAWMLSWSLCVEEHFYLVLPLLVLAIGRAPARVAVAVAAAAVLVSPVLRAFAYPTASQQPYGVFIELFYCPSHLRLDGLAMGVCCAAISVFRPRLWSMLERHRRALAALGVVVFVIAAWTPWLTGWTGEDAERMRLFAAVPGFALVSLGAALMLPLAASARPAPSWGRWVTPLAEHAYTLYLTHELARGAALKLTAELPLPVRMMAISIAIAASAVVLRRAVELPGLRLRDAWEARARSAPAPTAE